MAKFVYVRHLYQLTGCAVSRKVAAVVVHGVACLFVYFFQVRILVYAVNWVQLIALCLLVGALQLLILTMYNVAWFKPIVIFILKNVGMNHYK